MALSVLKGLKNSCTFLQKRSNYLTYFKMWNEYNFMGIKTSCFKYLLTLPHSHLFVFKTCIESQNDLVARDIKDHRAPKPRLWAGTLPLDQVAQRPIHPGLEHYQDWGIHFTGQLVLCLSNLTVKNYFLISNLNLLSFRLKPFPIVLSVNALKKSPSPSFW